MMLEDEVEDWRTTGFSCGWGKYVEASEGFSDAPQSVLEQVSELLYSSSVVSGQ